MLDAQAIEVLRVRCLAALHHGAFRERATFYPAYKVQASGIDQQWADLATDAAFEFPGIVGVAALINCPVAGLLGCRTLRKTP